MRQSSDNCNPFAATFQDTLPNSFLTVPGHFPGRFPRLTSLTLSLALSPLFPDSFFGHFPRHFPAHFPGHSRSWLRRFDSTLLAIPPCWDIAGRWAGTNLPLPRHYAATRLPARPPAAAAIRHLLTAAPPSHRPLEPPTPTRPFIVLPPRPRTPLPPPLPPTSLRPYHCRPFPSPCGYLALLPNGRSCARSAAAGSSATWRSQPRPLAAPAEALAGSFFYFRGSWPIRGTLCFLALPWLWQCSQVPPTPRSTTTFDLPSLG